MQYFKYAILQIENCKSQFCIFTIVFFEFDILKNQFFKIARYIPTKVEGGGIKYRGTVF